MDLRIADIRSQMIGCQMGVAPHHAFCLPASELLQSKQRRAALDVPARPGMSQVVKSKVFQTRALQSEVPSPRADLLDRLSQVREHVYGMLACLTHDDAHRHLVERHGD